MTDLSAGAWRKLFYNDENDYPPSQPQHERRKYLCRTQGRERLWLKFAGLGRYGEQKLERARALAEAGFARECSD